MTVFTGCSQATPAQDTAARSAPPASTSGAAPVASGSALPPDGGLDDQQLAAKLADASAPLTPELHEALLVRVAPCKLDDSDLDWPKVIDCPPLERFERETKRPSGDEGKLMEAGTNFRAKAQGIAIGKLASDSPALRYVAVKTIFLFPWDDVPPPMLLHRALRSALGLHTRRRSRALNERSRASSCCKWQPPMRASKRGSPCST